MVLELGERVEAGEPAKGSTQDSSMDPKDGLNGYESAQIKNNKMRMEIQTPKARPYFFFPHG